MIRTSLFGICTNIAINFHFTTLPLINRHGPIGLYFLFFILTVFDIYSLPFYLNVYLLYVAHVSYIIKRISYGMVWYGMVDIESSFVTYKRMKHGPTVH